MANKTNKNLILLAGILVFSLFPFVGSASTASDFKVNPQSTYAVPPGTNNVLILDLTLPSAQEGLVQQLKSIKINNIGNISDDDISKMVIFEDGSSSGWDGDEIQVAEITAKPFWGVDITGAFKEYRYPTTTDSWQRIFVTLDIRSTVATERTIQPYLAFGTGDGSAAQFVFSSTTANGPTDVNVQGLIRQIFSDASVPGAPMAPLAGLPESLSTSTIRWKFTDLSNNEFGFKILDSSLRVVAKKNEVNLSFLDEEGLLSNTNYIGRRAISFNDRGDGPPSATFSEIYTKSAVPTVVLVEATEASIKIKAGETLNNLTAGNSGIYFENVTLAQNSGWLKQDSWTSEGLAKGTEYEFRAKTRNGDGAESAFSPIFKFTASGAAVPVVPPVTPPAVTPPAEKPVSEMTVEELQAKIAELLLLISQLQAQVAGLSGGTAICSAPAVNLKYGDAGNEVKKLQEALIKEGLLKSGLNTGMFGSLTKAAVISFQEKYRQDILTPSGLSAGTGFVGLATRKKLSSICGQ